MGIMAVLTCKAVIFVYTSLGTNIRNLNDTIIGLRTADASDQLGEKRAIKVEPRGVSG
ncbi:hypothetical protein F5Y06DRAFT_267073 [Hypoxylon sp. FL0890]|nr:hypothetical protein F5Y06DRAFT_267073 [Hypoxylon sp. FL0890]